MTTKSIQISEFSIDDFMSMIEEKVSQSLEKFIGTSPNQFSDKDCYTRKETSEILGVSYGTLFNWNRDKILCASKIGHRVYYAKEEVHSKLKLTA